MNNILLLTDFSEASLHAGRYAALLTQQFRSERLVLYHAYQVAMPLPVSDIPSSYEFVPTIEDSETLRRKSLLELQSLYNTLRGLAYTDTIMEYRTEDANLAISINDIVKEAGADLVVMAISSASKLERTLLGDDNIHIADECRCPVLMVPPGTYLSPIHRIVFACDLKKTQEITPIKGLKKLLDDLQAELLVVNVDHKEKRFTPETPLNAVVLGRWLTPYQPVFYYIDNPDPVAGITEFARAQKASLIIVIHKTHGFFEGLFHRSATRQLVHHTSTPLLVMREGAQALQTPGYDQRPD
jgi:nucleotide-binding universal stress UspA family protein